VPTLDESVLQGVTRVEYVAHHCQEGQRKSLCHLYIGFSSETDGGRD